VGLGAWVAGPHYSAADADALDLISASRCQCIRVSVHYGHCEHHDDGCAESAHDRERHGLVTVFHCSPPCSVICEKTLLTNFGSAEPYEFFFEKFTKMSGASF
jgi:hypothetical protein